MPGDSEETIASKASLRERKIRELSLQSGGAFEADMYLRAQQQPAVGVQQQGMAQQSADDFIFSIIGNSQ